MLCHVKYNYFLRWKTGNEWNVYLSRFRMHKIFIIDVQYLVMYVKDYYYLCWIMFIIIIFYVEKMGMDPWFDLFKQFAIIPLQYQNRILNRSVICMKSAQFFISFLFFCQVRNSSNRTVERRQLPFWHGIPLFQAVSTS